MIPSDSELLKTGREIAIPGFTQGDYRIQKMETIQTIAQKINFSADCLLLLNQDKNLTHLKVGDILQLPYRVTQNIVNPKKY
mgnify:CR=1 FL=1